MGGSGAGGGGDGDGGLDSGGGGRWRRRRQRRRAAVEGGRGPGVRGEPRVAAAAVVRGCSGSGMNREAKRVISREVCIARICLRAFFSVFSLDSRATPSSTMRVLNMVTRDLPRESQRCVEKRLVALLQPTTACLRSSSLFFFFSFFFIFLPALLSAAF